MKTFRTYTRYPNTNHLNTRFLLSLIISVYLSLGSTIVTAQSSQAANHFNKAEPADSSQLNQYEPLELNRVLERYPNAQVRYITPKQALQLKNQPGVVMLPSNQVQETDALQLSNTDTAAQLDELDRSELNKAPQQTINANQRCAAHGNSPREVSHEQGSVSAIDNIFNGPDIIDTAGSDDLAIIIFVVVGIVITVFLIAYTLKFMYDVVNKEELCFWWSVNTHSNAIISTNDNGHFNGIKLSSGLIDEKVDVGISLDIGKLNTELELEDNTVHKVRGSYLMLGPSIRFYQQQKKNASYFALDLLVGSVNYEEKNILSYAKAAYNFPVNEHLRFGLSIGSLYLDLDNDKDLVRKDNSFNLTAGLEVGYQF